MISNLAVIEGERLVDEIVFEMPIAYGQTDLTDKEAHVNLRRADGSTDKIVVPFVVDGETIFVTWKLDATATAVPGELDVQVAKEYGQIRVRNAKGRPIAGAYVKVYSRDASGRVTKFHKDGYTDLRGAFDYASVSTDSEFRPAEFALFVEGAAAGVKTLRAPMPNGE